jgi:hypothetical protein
LTFERPLALTLLAAVPLAWWFHRRRSGAPVVRVASLLAFHGAATTTPSAAPRRAFDLRLALVLGAMTLCALAAAAPTFGAIVAPAFYVVVDKSVSMTARTCDAEKRAESLLKDVSPDAGRFVHDLANADGTDGLPESLASRLEAARADGFPGVVLVTDTNAAEMPGVAIVGPSAVAASNVSVASAVLDGDDAVVSVRNFGAKDVTVKLACADVVRDVAVPAGGIGTARFAAPDRGEMATFEIASPPDDLAADDRLVVARRGGARRVGGDLRSEAHLLAALRAAGAQVSAPGECDAVVQFGGGVTPLGSKPHFIVSPRNPTNLSSKPLRLRLDARIGFSTVRGDEIVGRGAFADVLPSPGTTLVACGRLDGGEAIWSDAKGVLAARDGDLLVLAVDPEDPRSDWHRDPSFPAFVAAALDLVTDGPDRLVPLRAVAASESDVVHDPPETSSSEAIRAVMRPAGTDPGETHPARWLALAAAILLGAAAFVRRS